MTEQAIKAVFDNAKEIPKDMNHEPPRPLRRPLAAAQGYPVDLLGKDMARAVRAIHNKIQAPDAICAQSVLATVTLVTQGHGDIVLHTGQSRPSSEYFLTVADSGERKTSADNEAQRGIESFEKELWKKYTLEKEDYDNQCTAWDRQRAQILNDKKKHPSQSSKKQALDELGPAPISPLFPAIICPEPTYEGLCKLLAIGQPSMGIFSNEGGQFVGGHGMKEDNRLKTAAGMSDLWDGKTIKRVRSGDGASIIPNRRLSMHLMVQPMVFGQFYADSLLESQGIFSRILVAAPDSVAGKRMFKTVSAQDEHALQEFSERLLSILQTPLPLVDGTHNELSPRCLELAPKAKELLIKFSDHVETQLAEGQAYQPIKPLANKLAEHAARLAATKALFVDLSASQVDQNVMAEAIGLVEFYAAEALRLRGTLSINPTLALAEKALIWMQTRWGESFISLPDIYQFGPNGIEDKSTAVKIVDILRDHGWLISVQGGEIVRGQKRREVWRIVRAL
ncbi:MAG: YfjI family protein [Alphaproteobacteria bacterium]|nr:YfjI family protein [Alphaproteobacteria bacterium]